MIHRRHLLGLGAATLLASFGARAGKVPGKQSPPPPVPPAPGGGSTPGAGVADDDPARLAALTEGEAALARDPFPGSVGFAVEYAPQTDTEPAWPFLRSGFFGRTAGDGTDRMLGIDMVAAGPRGGPLFDTAGRLAGIALPDGTTQGRLLGCSRLAAMNSGGLAGANATSSPLPLDEIYERSLRTALQVIVAP